MAADATLVSGQFRAKQHYDMGQAAARNRASKMISQIKPKKKEEEEVTTPKKAPQVKQVPQVKTITPEVEDPNVSTELAPTPEKDPVKTADEKETDDAALENQGLLQGDKDQVRKLNEKRQKKFYTAVVNSDNADMEYLLSSAEGTANDMNAFNETLLQLNEDYSNRGDHTQYGYGGAFTNAPEEEQQWVRDMIKGGSNGMKVLVINDQLVVEGPPKADGTIDYYTEPQLRNHLAQYEMDNTTFNVVHDLAQEQRKKGEEEFKANKDGIQGSFDRGNVSRGVQGLVGKGNLKSMIFDKSFGNSSYADDIFNSDDLKNIKYSDLNLDPPEGDEGGTITQDDGINDDLKKQIIDKLLNDKRYESALQKSVGNYFTSHIERNYYATANLDAINKATSSSTPSANIYTADRQGHQFSTYGGQSATDLINSVQ